MKTYTIVDAINDGNVLPFRIDYVDILMQGIANLFRSGYNSSMDVYIMANRNDVLDFINSQKADKSLDIFPAAKERTDKKKTGVEITSAGLKLFAEQNKMNISSNDVARSSVTRFAATHYLGR